MPRNRHDRARARSSKPAAPPPAGAVTAAVTKPSNPKDALGIRKTPISTVPAPVLSELGVAMLEGALKYGRHNYRVIGVRASVYYDATVGRHMQRWWEGEDLDPDSGLSHITKAIASLVVLRDAMIRGTWVDDRPPASKPGWQDEHDAHVRALLEKYPQPILPYCEREDEGMQQWKQAA
jgi:hypothetical protein